MTILATPALYAVWILMVVGEAALFAVLLTRKRFKTFPIFTGYSGLILVKSLVLIYVSFHDQNGAYFYTYYPATVIESLVVLAVIAEVFNKVFAPKRLLTPKSLHATLAVYGIVVLTFVILAVSNIREHPIGIMQLARFIERVSTFVLFASFAFLCGLSKYLTIPWRKHAFGLGAGFIVALSVSAVFNALLAWCSVGSYQILRFIGMGGTILSEIIWVSYFWRNEPELVPVSEQTMHEIAKLLTIAESSILQRKVC